MPRMLAPRKDSLSSRRSITSLHGFKTSLHSYISISSSLRTSTSSSGDYQGSSQFSLRRSSMMQNNPTPSLRRQVTRLHKHNDAWNIENQGSDVTQGTSSLATSDTSVITELSLSGSSSSSQSSLQQPNILVRSPRQALLLLMHSTNNNNCAQRSPRSRNSFFPSAQIMEKDTWGQFVDTEEAEHDLSRRSKIQYITRLYLANSRHLGPQLR
mmetsp:Transcript_10248/g.18718  ORF Transcript_10248/g.18718 Transcript_10248/m.18718 type:complete len:212 (-) Transcript_10248:820-1455(-)